MPESQSLLKRMIVSAINAREVESERVSRLLHDEVGQVLSAVGLHLDVLKLDFKEQAPEIVGRVHEIQQILDHAVKQVRSLSYDLNPAVVERAGLHAALERLVGEVRKLPPDVHPLVQALWCQPKCFHAMADHLQMLARDGRSIAGQIPPPDIPVVVISSGDQTNEQVAAQRTLADSSLAGRHVIATRSAHWVQFDEPELVVTVIRELVESKRIL